jgi:O-antigen/teichoic acid export membrane protein
MKVLVQRLRNNINYKKAIEWGKLITITSITQLIIQLIGFTSGILVIRTLSLNEYALYTLANSILATMILLTDGGISAGVISEGGKVWQDKKRLGIVLVTGLRLRKIFSIFSFAITIPVLLFLLNYHGTDWKISILIILSIIPAFFTNLSSTLLEIIPKLRQDVIPIQKIELGTNVLRLVILCFTLFIFPWAFIAILGSSLPQIWANYRLRKISSKYADEKQRVDPEINRKIISLVKRILPGAVYYCFSSQITIWFISVLGSTAGIAQLGALTRLSIILNFFNILFNTLILPRFARLPANPGVLLNRFIQIQLGLLVLLGSIVYIISIFPSQILWVLGKAYSDLSGELLLSIIGSCLALIAAFSFSICTVRGWVINPIVSIGIGIISIIGCTLMINISSLRDILILGIFTNSVQVIMHVCYYLIKVRRIKTTMKVN